MGPISKSQAKLSGSSKSGIHIDVAMHFWLLFQKQSGFPILLKNGPEKPKKLATENEYISNCTGQVPDFSGEPEAITQKGDFSSAGLDGSQEPQRSEIYRILFAILL